MPHLVRLFVLVALLSWGAAPWAADIANFAQPAGKIVIRTHMTFVLRTLKPITRVAVADPSLVDAEVFENNRHQVMLVAREKTGFTSLVVWHGEQHADTYQLEVRLHDHVWQNIQEAIQRLVPGARVRVDRLGDKVVLDGAVDSQKDLDRVLEVVKSFTPQFTNMIAVQGSQQVQLEVKVAEVSRSGIKQLGLGFLLDKDYKVAGFPTGTAAGAMAATRTRDSQRADSKTSELGSLATLTSPYPSAFQVLVHALSDDVLGLLSLLKGQGLTRILASPTLVTMSGQQAHFLVGGEIPYQIVSATGTPGIDWKQYGIMLKFTPFVLGEETITISVDPEVSAPDFSNLVVSGGAAVPSIITRTGHSTLQLKDGQVFAMAGLLHDEMRSAVNKVPILGEIPILGTLFTSKEFHKKETELVVLVRPKIVRALNPQEAPPLPGDTLERDVSDLDFFILNRGVPKTAGPGVGPPAKAPAFEGDIGFCP